MAKVPGMLDWLLGRREASAELGTEDTVDLDPAAVRSTGPDAAGLEIALAFSELDDGRDTDLGSAPRATIPEAPLPFDVPPPHRRVPDLPERFTERGRIGRGGMGTVYQMRDVTLRRDVAMKVLDPKLLEHRASVQSFIEEAQITGQLDHPNIVPIHELGCDTSGMLYFTMRIVRGETLYSKLHDPVKPPGSPDRLAESLEVFLRVCDAVSFAHSRGVIHRDIKPDNVMVGAFGESYLMDWGLSRVKGDGPGCVDIPRTPHSPLAGNYQGMVGTPAYMAPEQARGEAVDERSDVFGLGAVLYQIVTGKIPYDRASEDEEIEAAKRWDLLPPERAAPDIFIPNRLSRIVMKAMAKEPKDRYQTSADLKAAVQRFLRGGFHLPRQTFPAGSLIVREGEAGDAAYILTRGHCDVFKTVDGDKRILRRMGPGTVFGETAVISSLPRTASVEAVGEVHVLVLTRAVVDEGLGLDTWEGMLVKSLVSRFRELDERLTELERERVMGEPPR